MAYDPQKIINTANSFSLAADRALEQRLLGPGQFQMLLVPAVVSTAFAVELYFKGIITLESGNTQGHNLSELFKRLSPESQAALAAGLELDRQIFNQKLEAISKVFVQWRYIFEHQTANLEPLFLAKLARESKRVAEEMAASNLKRNTSDKPARSGIPR
ncbi:hypothetical protein ACU6VJ_02070 [Sphaerotilus sulfidivorans]|nr:hypothetical protein CQA4T8M7_30500 [Sphaerotilus natans]